MFNKAIYEKEHSEIFNEYRLKYQNRNSYLIEDGVIDVNEYSGVLFLLKEAYKKERKFGEYNLVSDLNGEGPWSMWHRACEWVWGIGHTTKDNVEPYRNFLHEEKRKALLSFAVVNVKKVDGNTSSEDGDLQEYVDENKNRLRREIMCAQPKIIICGNTFSYLQDILDVKIDRNCENWYYWLNISGLGEVLVLDYYHPAVRYPALPMYYGITNIYRQALINKPAYWRNEE